MLHINILSYTPKASMKKKKNSRSFQKGENHTNAKLTEEQVKEIRLVRRKTHMTYAKLAKQYQVSTGTISRICNNQAWT